MHSKKNKHQHVSNDAKTQITPLYNSTNTVLQTNQNGLFQNLNSNITTANKTSLTNNSNISLGHLSLIRGHKSELDLLNSRFSNYVDALRQKTEENQDLQRKVDVEKQKQRNVIVEDNHDLEIQMNDLRHEVDESAVLIEHFLLKHDRSLKELALLKDKIRNEENNSYAKRRPLLENDYQQTLVQLQELKCTIEELQKISQDNKSEIYQLNNLHKKLEDELHDLTLNNIRLQNNLRTIEEQILFRKAAYETEKTELVNEQTKQNQFYNNELGKAINEIKHDFQILLKNNQTLLENSYSERIEQTKAQILAYETAKQNEQPLAASRSSIDTLQNELKQSEKARQDIENEYRSLVDLYISKQNEKNQTDEERHRLDTEYNRLIDEINHLTQAINTGKQYWFSVHFELETYRRLLDLESSKPFVSIKTIATSTINDNTSNGNNQKSLSNDQEIPNFIDEQITKVKKSNAQRAISKTGKFDIDQVQAGFISINNAATDCIDQPLKGWKLIRTINDGSECVFQFPEGSTLRARTRVRVYSSKVDNMGNSSLSNSRLIASSIPSWTGTNQGDNVKIVLLDDKGNNKAQYSETWQ